MKRLVALLLALFLLCISLSACNLFHKTPKVAICVPGSTSLDISYVEKQLTELGCEVSVYDQSSDQDAQTKLINQLFSEKFSLIIVELFSETAAESIYQSESRKDTKLLFVNSYISVLGAVPNTSFLVCAPSELGALQAQSVADIPNSGDINGDGNLCYAILSGNTNNQATRFQTERIITGLLGETHLTTIQCDRPEDAGELCSNLLATYGRDLELLICADSKLTEAAAAAITQAGRIPGDDLYVIGAGETPEVIDLLESNAICSTVAPIRTDETNQIVEIATYMINGDPYRSTYSFNYAIIQ